MKFKFLLFLTVILSNLSILSLETYQSGDLTAVFYKPTNTIMYSQDGIDWYEIPPKTMYSEDGIHWYEAPTTTPLIPTDFPQKNNIMYSKDGIKWFPIQTDTPDYKSVINLFTEFMDSQKKQ